MAVLDAIERLVAEVAPTLFGTTSAAGLDRLERDHDTVMGSLARAIEQDRSRPAAAITLGLNRYWLLSGRVVEAARWIVATRSLNDLSSVDECRLDILAGTFASYLSAPAAVGQLVEALGRAENLGVPADRLVVNGWCCLAAAEAREATPTLRRPMRLKPRGSPRGAVIKGFAASRATSAASWPPTAATSRPRSR